MGFFNKKPFQGPRFFVPKTGALTWSGCSVRIRLWPRLPCDCHCLLSLVPMYGTSAGRSVSRCSSLDPASTSYTSASGSIGLGVHTGQGSLPPRVAMSAGPIQPRVVGLVRGLRLKNLVGPSLVKVSLHTTCNIEGVKQHDPSVLHDTDEAVEGEVGADSSERTPYDEVEKLRLRGRGGSSPSIATSSDASSCTDAWGDMGKKGCGVRNVVRGGPTWYGVAAAAYIEGVRSTLLAVVGCTADHSASVPGVGLLALLEA